MEINFFDTSLNIVRKQYYIEAKIYKYFHSIEVWRARRRNRCGENSKKEKLREHSSVGSAIVGATAVKERVARKRKARVVSLFPIKLNIYII